MSETFILLRYRLSKILSHGGSTESLASSTKLSEKQTLSHSQSSESLLKPNAAKGSSANSSVSSINPNKPQNEIKTESTKTLVKAEIPKSLTKPVKVPVVVSKPANPVKPAEPVNPPQSSLYSGNMIENNSSDEESSSSEEKVEITSPIKKSSTSAVVKTSARNLSATLASLGNNDANDVSYSDDSSEDISVK